jgi:hypothetical protein
MQNAQERLADVRKAQANQIRGLLGERDAGACSKVECMS